jgi:RNA polymerase sigma-70 factor (ECF subfamily)
MAFPLESRVGPEEAALLAAAREGDEHAFAQLTGRYRRELQVHCYRMLGSLDDAEDLVQETMLRAWRRLGGFEGRTSLRRWLYRIATNACLNTLEREPRVVLFPTGGDADPPPLARTSWLEPYPDSLLPDPAEGDPEARLDLRESIALAFLAAIQQLPPRQRAMLVLFDVLGWSASEIAELLETSVSAVNSGLQRARATLDARPAPRPSEEDERVLVERFVAAWERVDIEGLVVLLREDAVMAMPPEPVWFSGAPAVGEFFATVPAEGDLTRIKLVPTRANHRPALAAYFDGQAFGIMVFEVRDGLIAQIVGFADAARSFERFGLPERVEHLSEET